MNDLIRPWWGETRSRASCNIPGTCGHNFYRLSDLRFTSISRFAHCSVDITGLIKGILPDSVVQKLRIVQNDERFLKMLRSIGVSSSIKARYIL